MGFCGGWNKKVKTNPISKLGFLSLELQSPQSVETDQFLATTMAAKEKVKHKYQLFFFHKVRVNFESFTLNDRCKKKKIVFYISI